MLSLSVDIWRPVVSGGRAAPPPANMLVWLKKGNASGALWTDSGPNFNDMTLVNTPTIAGGTVTFNGTNQSGNFPSGGLLPIVTYLRFQVLTHTPGAYVLDGFGAVNKNALVLGSTAGGNHIEMRDSAGTSFCDTAPLSTGWHSIGFGQHDNGTSAVINLDGVETVQATFTQVLPGGMTLGASAGGAASWSNIEVAEVICYYQGHTALQRSQTIAYLNTR